MMFERVGNLAEALLFTTSMMCPCREGPPVFNGAKISAAEGTGRLCLFVRPLGDDCHFPDLDEAGQRV